MIIGAVLILALALLLLWFGFAVETGRRRPKPKDHFFPLMGRNVDYVLGAAGLLAGFGSLCILAGLWLSQDIAVVGGIALIIAGLARAYLDPHKFGPDWVRQHK